MAKKSVIPVEIRRKMIRAREEGQSLARIGRTYGFSESGVYRFLKHYEKTGKLEPKEHSQKAAVTREKVEKIQDLINKNPKVTLKEIREQSGLEMSTHRISYIIKKYTPNERIACMPLTPEMHKKILASYDKGMKLNEIAKVCNCSMKAVAEALDTYRKKGVIGYRYKRIPEKIKSNVARDRILGLSLDEIASKYGLKLKTVGYILKPYIAAGKVKRQNHRKMSAETQAKIADDYNKGLSRNEITVNSGYCRDTVDKTLRHLNETGKIKFRKPRKEIPEEIKTKIFRDRKQGFTMREIADTYDIALSTVHVVLRGQQQ